MTHRRPGLIGAILVFAALTALVTWPQALVPASRIANHHDAQFSIWRLGWIAHALATSPGTLFDANIFHPARATLAYSDATLLEGLIGAPLFWAGLPPALVYNLLLFAGFIGSGLGMFVLARHLTGQTAAALIAGAVFVLLPYRTEHVMHLELQWAMFVPLTWWALHRVVEAPNTGRGVVAGAMLALQTLACVYYGVFLTMTLLMFVPILLISHARRAAWRPSLAALTVAAVVALVLVAPLAWPYLTAARTVGGRTTEEVTRYSATLTSYLSSPEVSRIWGWTANRWGSPELRLFPGLLAFALAMVGLVAAPRARAVLYLLTLIAAVELSFGLNGVVYRALFTHVDAVQGFRATARFAVIGSTALAVLAAFGSAYLMKKTVARLQPVLAAGLVLAMAAEGWHRPVPLTGAEPIEPPSVYQVLAKAAPGAILELPLPAADRLPGNDPQYEIWSLWHWRPLVNGYSGYYPRDYLMTLARMNVFPGEGTIDRLRAHDVRFIIVHRAFYDQESYTRLMLRMATRPELKPWGAYRDTLGTADIFELIAVD